VGLPTASSDSGIFIHLSATGSSSSSCERGPATGGRHTSALSPCSMTADMPDLILHGPRPVPAHASELGANVPPLSDTAKAGGRRQSHSHGPFLVSRLVHCVGNLLLSWRDGLSGSEREDRRRKQERIETLVARMQNVNTTPRSLAVSCSRPADPAAGRHAEGMGDSRH
jgi:hypothetical protein